MVIYILTVTEGQNNPTQHICVRDVRQKSQLPDQMQEVQQTVY